MPQRMDHGLPVDETRRCEAMTKRASRCKNPPLVDSALCAYHAGLAQSRIARGLNPLTRLLEEGGPRRRG